MKSLLQTNINIPVYVLCAVIIRLNFVEISWASYLAVMISLHQFILLFNSIGHVIPIRYLFGSLMCLQFFVGPTFAYNGLDEYLFIIYTMRVPEEQYFAYAIPAVLLFIAGLNINAGQLRGEFVDQPAITHYVEVNPRMPYFFIALGLCSSVVSAFFGSELALFFYLVGGFKFIGLFLLMLGRKQLNVGAIVLVVGTVISTSLGGGMFHDLLTWLIFFLSVLSIRYKFKFRAKAIGAAVFITMVVILQILKGEYRETLGPNKKESDVETFARLAVKRDQDGGLFSLNSLATSNVRINQGFIITNIMKKVPDKVPYENGREMYQVLEAAILPRFLAPNKLGAGDRKTFMKYSGIILKEGTTMSLSSLGDAYVNFAAIGGCIFMFFLGLLYSNVLIFFHKHSATYPILILFTSLVFYYPIRPDCELQTILGHLFKSCFVIYVVLQVWKVYFAMPVLLQKADQQNKGIHEQ